MCRDNVIPSCCADQTLFCVAARRLCQAHLREYMRRNPNATLSSLKSKTRSER